MGAESGGDEIAEEARRLIKERQFNPQRFLAEIDKGWYTDVELCDLPAVQRALLVPALRAMLPDRSGDIRLNIARALFELGDHLGWQTLHQCLTGDDAQSQQGALKRLSDLSYGQKARGYKMFVDAGVDALERPLAAASAWTRREAIHLLARLRRKRFFKGLVARCRPRPHQTNLHQAQVTLVQIC